MSLGALERFTCVCTIKNSFENKAHHHIELVFYEGQVLGMFPVFLGTMLKTLVSQVHTVHATGKIVFSVEYCVNFVCLMKKMTFIKREIRF